MINVQWIAVDALKPNARNARTHSKKQIRQIANILAYVSWIVVILSPWGERQMTEQDLKKIEAAFARIEASVGIGGH